MSHISIQHQCHNEDLRFIALSHSIAVKQYEVKHIIDTHNRHLKKQKKIDDLADKLRKEQSTFSGRKRLKNKQKTLVSERKRLQRASQGT
jgi:transcriptional regulator GlxA family with amidase domain